MSGRHRGRQLHQKRRQHGGHPELERANLADTANTAHNFPITVDTVNLVGRLPSQCHLCGGRTAGPDGHASGVD
jgi:hypothetical protein